MNDRGTEQAAESAVVRDRERPSLDLLGIQFSWTWPAQPGLPLLWRAAEALSIRVSHHRHQEPIVQSCGDTNMKSFLTMIP